MAGQTLLDMLQHGAAADPAIAVPDGVRLTYGELRQQVAAAADDLAQLGVSRQDRVALVLPNSAEAIVPVPRRSDRGDGGSAQRRI